ncbi:MAG: glycoside hydrolase family 127 protein [Candidatus Aminicenantes bacterium]|nr:glycoside hydrolase family 127 protein [Candidatus Aminicenantes bacterium]
MDRRLRRISLFVLSAFLAGGLSCAQKPKSDYAVTAVPLTAVKFTDGFWAKRQQADIAVTIRHEMMEAENTNRIKNFEIAAAALKGATGGQFATAYAFDDSDVYKIIEAASYVLMLHPDPELDKALDGWIAKIAAAQEPDGYIYTARTSDPKNPPRMSGKERWTNERDSHELYNAGHMYEAAVAHYQATGKKNFLNVALKNADFIDKTFGPGKDQLKFVPGHEVTEMGLVKLYRATGKIKYLNLAKFFIDERGNAAGHELYGTYNQDHKPVVEQTEAVGHAVRAAYLYAGVTDVAALTGDRRTMEAMDKIWTDIVSKKLYLTGGIGAAGGIEGFGPAYDLPNPTGYAETCATIAYALWNYRMFLYYGDGKYMDLFERAAYNAFLSGYGMSGDLFFYPNPLASHGQHMRTPWFTCACCPPNVARFIAELGGFAYGIEGDKVFVNIYTQGTAELETKAGKVSLEQATDYPWTGDIKITVTPEKAAALTLMARIPGWAQGRPLPSDLYRYAEDVNEAPAVKVNGAAVALNLEKGYASIARTWLKGDVVEIHLPMPVRRVFANENLKADIGRVAVERGPLVFCAEGVDSDGTVSNFVLDDGAALTAEARSDLLNGVTVVTGKATAYRYKGGRLVSEKKTLTLIPYYAWAHRGRGEMEVWLARVKDTARPVPEPTTASTAKVSSSEGGKGVEAVHDLYEPENSNDHAHGYLHWWPKKGTSEWIQYDFGKPVTLSETSVYWFDDTGEGECRVPASWKAFYKAGDKWVPVKNVGPYGVEKDKYNTVRFAPVNTAGLRLEIRLPEKFSAGIQEWKVK